MNIIGVFFFFFFVVSNFQHIHYVILENYSFKKYNYLQHNCKGIFLIVKYYSV